jgi:hypothetical protein
MNIRNVLICAALAVAPACSKSPDAMMDKMVGMMEEMGKTVESANGDCGKMASGLEDITKKYEGDIKEMKAMGDKMKNDKAEQERLMKKYGDRMQKVMPAMMGMAKCADDPKMKEVQSKLSGMM